MWLRGAIGSIGEPEWLIAFGRLVTCLFAGLAIYLDPTKPSRLLGETQFILAGYALFALFLVLFPSRRRLDAPAHIATHAVDVLVLGLLMWLTDELSSPFFAFLPFTLFATALRWGMRGAIAGGIVLEITMILVGWPDLEDGEPELNVVIMRSAYLLVAAMILGYLGAYRDRSRQRLSQLAAWPLAPATRERHAWLRDILDHAAEVLETPCLVVLWHDLEKSTGMLGVRDEAGLHMVAVDDRRFWLVHGPRLASPSNRALEAQRLAELLAALPDTAVAPGRAAYVCAAPIAGIRYRGRLFVLDARYRHDESAALTEMIATRIGYELERLALVREIANAARAEERVRVARDLHDSVLQDLTAAGLKLKAATNRVPKSAQPALSAVSALMADQQRRIRLFVENERRGGMKAHSQPVRALADNVRSLRKQWDCNLVLKLDPPDIDLPAPVCDAVSKLISEATANAVKHGRATQVDLMLTRAHDRLRLGIADNGVGIPDPAAFERSGPMSLRGRVDDLAGSLSITRFAPGLAMTIELPLP